MKEENYTTIGDVLYRKCTSKIGCGEIKIAEGNFHRFKKRGKVFYNSMCKVCFRAYQRGRHRQHNALEPYGDLVQSVNWKGTGRPVVTGMFGA